MILEQIPRGWLFLNYILWSWSRSTGGDFFLKYISCDPGAELLAVGCQTGVHSTPAGLQSSVLHKPWNFLPGSAQPHAFPSHAQPNCSQPAWVFLQSTCISRQQCSTNSYRHFSIITPLLQANFSNREPKQRIRIIIDSEILHMWPNPDTDRRKKIQFKFFPKNLIQNLKKRKYITGNAYNEKKENINIKRKFEKF